MTGNLLVRLGLKSEDFTKGLDQANKKLTENKKQFNKADKQVKDFGKSLNALKGNFLALSAVMVSTGYTIKKIRDEFSSFETKLIDMSRVTNRTFENLKKDVMKLPAELGKATDLMAGYYQVFSAGINDADEAQKVLIQTAKTSKFAHLDHAEVIKGLTKVMAGYEGQIKTVTEASDLLVAIEKQGQTSVAELIPVIGSLAKMSSDLNISTDEMGASLALISQTAGSTAEAATYYQAILTGLMKPTTEMSELFKDLGGAQKAIQKLGFEGTLKMIEQAAGGSAEKMAAFFGSVEALKGVSTLTIDDFSRLNQTILAMSEKTGMSEEAWGKWLQTSEATDEFLKSSFSKILIDLGEKIVPKLDKELRELMTGLSNWVNENEETVISFLQSFITLVKGVGTAAEVVAKNVGWIPQYVADLAAGLALVKEKQISLVDYMGAPPEELRTLIEKWEADPVLTALEKRQGEIERILKSRETLSKFSIGHWFGKEETEDTKALRIELEKLNHGIGVIEFNKIAEEMGLYDIAINKIAKSTEEVKEDTVSSLKALGDFFGEIDELDDIAIEFWENYENITSTTLQNETRKLDEKYEDWKEHFGDLEELNEAYEVELGRIYDKYGAKAIKTVNEVGGATESAIEEAARKTEELWIHALENVQDATADIFYDIFTGAIDGWEDMADRFKDYFLRTLSEMAAQALMKPIIIPMMQGIMGLPGTSGAGQPGGALAGLLGYSIGGQDVASYLKGGAYGALGYSALAESFGMPTGTEATIGAGIGGALGSLIPIPALGTALGAAVGGAIGGLFSEEERAYIGAQFEVGWDEGFDIEKVKEWSKNIGNDVASQYAMQIQDALVGTLGAYEEIYNILDDTQKTAIDQSLSALGEITFGDITKGSTQEKLEKRFNTHLEQMMDEIYDTIGALFEDSLKAFSKEYISGLSTGQYGEAITSSIVRISELSSQESLTSEELYELANSLVQVEQAVETLNATWVNTQYEMDVMTGSVSELDQKLHDINVQFDNWASTMEQLGASQSVLAEIETERADAIEYATQQYEQSIMSGAYSMALSAMQPAISLYNSLMSYQTDKERSSWGISEYTDLLAEIAMQIESLDESSATYYEDSLALVAEQFDVVKEIEKLQDEIASSLVSSLSSINDIIKEMTMGDLAAVQSMEMFQNEYSRLISTITTSDDPAEITQAVSDLSTYMSDYLSFMGAYGGDYATLTDSILGDLESVQDAIINAGLETVGTSFADMIPELNWNDYISDPEMAAYFSSLQAIEANTAELTSDSSSYLVDIIAYLQTQVSQLSQLITIATLLETGAISTPAQMEAAQRAIEEAAEQAGGVLDPTEALEAAWEAVSSANVTPAGAPIFSADNISGAWTGTTSEVASLLNTNTALKAALESVAQMEGADYSSIEKYFKEDLASKTNRTFASGHGWSFDTNGQWTDIDIYRHGGLARGLGIIGDRGPEWAVPTYEPERSSFLRDVGADPNEIGESIARHIYPLLRGGEDNITIQLNIDGQHIRDVIVSGLKKDSRLIEAVRRIA